MTLITNRTARRIATTPESATVGIADQVSRLRAGGADVLDFSAGRASEATPAYVCRAAIAAMEAGDTHQTPAQGTSTYRAAAAAKLARENNLTVNPDTEIIATLGCKQGLLLALTAILDQGDEVIVEDPCFVSYLPEIQFAGGVAVPVPLHAENGFRWTREQLAAAITGRTRVLLFCSPQNPTGVVHTPEDLRVIADVAAEHDIIVIADETYERLAWTGHTFVSIAELPGMREHSINLMGVTKSFGMGGWRVGFARAPEDIIPAMVKVQQHIVTCPGSFTQAGAAVALKDAPAAVVLDLWQDWEKRCQFVARELNAAPTLSCAPCEGAFYAWIDISATGEPSQHLALRLLDEAHVALVPGSAFGPHGEGYLRMTCVKSWEDITSAVERIREAVAV